MRTTYKRAKALLLVVLFVISGMTAILFDFAVNGEKYAMKPVNQHLYKNGVLVKGGSILDCEGEALIATVDGKRVYSESPRVRMSMLHTLGDQYGFIATGVQSTFSSELIGYNLVTGIFNATKGKGNDLYLTMDDDICIAALKAMNGRKGCVGIYNYKTGEILCNFSSPTYDVYDKPQDIDSDEDGKYSGIYLNKLLFAQYVPGSVFKVLTAACAIDNIPDIFSRSFYCDGSWTAPDGQDIICNDSHGTLTFEQALNRSCNCAFAQIGIELGRDKLTQAAKKVGLLDGVTIDRNTTAKGKLDLSTASSSQLGWASFGQYTDIANPAAIMIMMGAIANGGTAIRPYYVDCVKSGEFTKVYSAKTEALGNYFSATTANSLKSMLRSTVTDYYGEGQFEGLELCAKSGTAEINNSVKPHSWFAGFCDREDFPYAFVVVVENGGSGYYTAGSVAAEVLQTAFDKRDSYSK